MKKIKLFLTSSLTAFEHDLEELGAFVGGLNDKYAAQDIYFQLTISGDNNFDEDMEAARNSELFYIIFHEEPQDNARLEFEAAYAAFREKKTPKIVTYYKQLDSGQGGGSALAFMDKLRNELGHFNSKYTHMDTIKLNIMLQLKSLGLEHIKVDVENDSLVVDGKEMLTLDNIPVMCNNKNLAGLKDEHDALDREFWELSDKVHKNPNDKEARSRFMALSGKLNTINESMHELQKNILKMETDFLEKAGKGYISPRLMQARQRFEDGDIEGAKQLLDLEQMLREDERDDELLEEMKKKKLAKVNEYLYLVNMLKTDVSDPGRFTAIERAYEQAVKIEEQYNLEDPTAAWEYSHYLFDQNNFVKALKYAQMHLRRIDDEEIYDYANACGFIALLYEMQDRFDEAEQLYQKVLAVHESIAGENPMALPGLVISYSNIAELFRKTERYEEALETHKKALAIDERLAKEDPEAYEYGLSVTYNNMALVHHKCGRFEEAEELYKKAEAIRRRLANQNPKAFESHLATTIRNMASLYRGKENYTEAEELYRKAGRIQEHLAEVNPAAFGPDLELLYEDMAGFYETTGQNSEIEKLYRKLLPIYERSIPNDPEKYEFYYSTTLFRLAELLYDMEQYENAEPVYRQLIETLRRLAEDQPEEYEDKLKFVLDKLGSMREKMGKNPEVL